MHFKNQLIEIYDMISWVKKFKILKYVHLKRLVKLLNCLKLEKNKENY